MTPAASILAKLRDRGARLFLVAGDRLAVAPRAALDDSLRAAIKREKPALLAMLRTTDPAAAPSFDYFTSRYADIFLDLTGDTGTVADLHAIAWAEQHGWPDTVTTLRAADRRCEELAAADDEAGFRHAVAQLVELFRAIRGAYVARVEVSQ